MKRFAFLLAVLATTAVFSQAEPIMGKSEGRFVEPEGEAKMKVTGVSTNFFTWGDENYEGLEGYWGLDNNKLKYDGEFFNGTPEEPFIIGQIKYYNGTTAPDTNAETVKLVVSILFRDGGIQDFTFPFKLISTKNEGARRDNADIVKFIQPFSEEKVTIDEQDYWLKLTFGNTTKDGFSEIYNFHVYEGRSATAELQATFTQEAPPPPLVEETTEAQTTETVTETTPSTEESTETAATQSSDSQSQTTSTFTTETTTQQRSGKLGAVADTQNMPEEMPQPAAVTQTPAPKPQEAQTEAASEKTTAQASKTSTQHKDVPAPMVPPPSQPLPSRLKPSNAPAMDTSNIPAGAIPAGPLEARLRREQRYGGSPTYPERAAPQLPVSTVPQTTPQADMNMPLPKNLKPKIREDELYRPMTGSQSSGEISIPAAKPTPEPQDASQLPEQRPTLVSPRESLLTQTRLPEGRETPPQKPVGLNTLDIESEVPVPLLTVENAVAIRFKSEKGYVYQLQASRDNVRWENISEIITGTGQEIVRYRNLEANAPINYKLKVSRMR